MLQGRTWIPAPCPLQLEFTIIVYCMCVTCFRFFQLHLWLSLLSLTCTAVLLSLLLSSTLLSAMSYVSPFSKHCYRYSSLSSHNETRHTTSSPLHSHYSTITQYCATRGGWKLVISGTYMYILKPRLTDNGDLEACLILPPPQGNNAKTVPHHDSIHTLVASCDWVKLKCCLSIQFTAILGLGSTLR